MMLINTMLIRFIFLYIASLFVAQASAMDETLITVKNPVMMEDGLTTHSLLDWFSKPLSLNQVHNGQLHLDILSNKLYLQKDTQWEPNPKCFQIEKKITLSRNIFYVKYNPQCLDIGKENDFKIAFVIKPGALYEMEKEKKELVDLNRMIPVLGGYLGDKKLPVLTHMEDAFQISGTNSAFLVLHPAIGKSVLNEITWPRDYNSQNYGMSEEDYLKKKIADAENIMGKVGFSFANMHLKGMDKTTMTSSENPFSLDENPFRYYRTSNIHGDAHLENIFYSLVGDRIFLIDNAAMSISTKKTGSILIDIAKIFTLHVNYLDPDSIQATIYREGYKAFFKSYIHTYPAEQQPYLKQYIADLVESNYSYYFHIDGTMKEYRNYANNKTKMRFSKIIADYIRGL